MPVHPAREALTWRDAKGNTARTTFYVDTQLSLTAANTAALAIQTAMVALTNCVLQAAIGPHAVDPQEVVYGTNSQYASVEDKAVFTFQTAAGDIHRFTIPAPKASIFLADGETVDAANTDVVAYTSAIIANAVTRGGQLIAFGAFGIRQRRKTRRKLNIFLKDPSLTEPAE